MLPQHADQMFLGDMRIALRRSDRSMPQELLNHPDVNAIAKQQRRHRMPEHVRSNVAFDAGVSSKLRDDISHPCVESRSPEAFISLLREVLRITPCYHYQVPDWSKPTHLSVGPLLKWESPFRSEEDVPLGVSAARKVLAKLSGARVQKWTFGLVI